MTSIGQKADHGSLQYRAGETGGSGVCGARLSVLGEAPPEPLEPPQSAKRGPGRPCTYPRLFDRLKANCEVNEFTGCWEWTGYRDRHGYPRLTIRIKGTPIGCYAHRLMLEEVHGVYFPYDEAGHLCVNPSCVNPHHLEIQTPGFNQSERAGYVHRDWKARMIPVLFPIEGWMVPPNYKPPVVHVGDECPF